jgi:hypothetical protein
VGAEQCRLLLCCGFIMGVIIVAVGRNTHHPWRRSSVRLQTVLSWPGLAGHGTSWPRHAPAQEAHAHQFVLYFPYQTDHPSIFPTRLAVPLSILPGRPTTNTHTPAPAADLCLRWHCCSGGMARRAAGDQPRRHLWHGQPHASHASHHTAADELLQLSLPKIPQCYQHCPCLPVVLRFCGLLVIRVGVNKSHIFQAMVGLCQVCVCVCVCVSLCKIHQPGRQEGGCSTHRVALCGAAPPSQSQVPWHDTYTAHCSKGEGSFIRE